MEVIPIFPVPVYVSDEYVPAATEVSALKTQDWIHNPDGNKFSANSYVLDIPALAGLRAFLQGRLEHFVHDVLAVTRNSQFFITQSWVTVKVRGTSHHLHAHPNSLVSGVFYLDGELAPIAFQRPATHELFGNVRLETDRTTPLNATECALPNQKNRAILFPSTTPHFVKENPADSPRYSIAFNSFARGLLGSAGGLTELRL